MQYETQEDTCVTDTLKSFELDKNDTNSKETRLEQMNTAAVFQTQSGDATFDISKSFDQSKEISSSSSDSSHVMQDTVVSNSFDYDEPSTQNLQSHQLHHNTQFFEQTEQNHTSMTITLSTTIVSNNVTSTSMLMTNASSTVKAVTATHSVEHSPQQIANHTEKVHGDDLFSQNSQIHSESLSDRRTNMIHDNKANSSTAAEEQEDESMEANVKEKDGDVQEKYNVNFTHQNVQASTEKSPDIEMSSAVSLPAQDIYTASQSSDTPGIDDIDRTLQNAENIPSTLQNNPYLNESKHRTIASYSSGDNVSLFVNETQADTQYKLDMDNSTYNDKNDAQSVHSSQILVSQTLTRSSDILSQSTQQNMDQVASDTNQVSEFADTAPVNDASELNMQQVMHDAQNQLSYDISALETAWRSLQSHMQSSLMMATGMHRTGSNWLAMLEKTCTENTDLKHRIADLELQHTELYEQLHEKEGSAKLFEAGIREERDKLRQELIDIRAEKDSLQRQLQKLIKVRDDLTQRLDETKSNSFELESQRKQLTQSNEDLQQKLQIAESRVEQVALEYATSKAENTTLTRKLEEIGGLHETATEQLKQLETKLANMNQEHETARLELVLQLEKSAQAQKLQAEQIEELKDDLKTMSEQKDKEHEARMSAEKKEKQNAGHIQTLRKQLKSAETQLSTLTEQYSDAQNECTLLKRELIDVRERMATATKLFGANLANSSTFANAAHTTSITSPDSIVRPSPIQAKDLTLVHIQSGQEIQVHSLPFILGRALYLNGIVITNQHVSRKHAQLELVGTTQLQIRRKSRNFLYVIPPSSVKEYGLTIGPCETNQLLTKFPCHDGVSVTSDKAMILTQEDEVQVVEIGSIIALQLDDEAAFFLRHTSSSSTKSNSAHKKRKITRSAE